MESIRMYFFRILIMCMLGLAHVLPVDAQNMFSFGTATNPDGRTLQVDSHGIIIDGKHGIPVMGEIHYSRVPRKDWRREVRKMKAGGITVIATYVFWIHHEEQEGMWDWSDNRDLHEFVRICQQEGMYVVLRLGPFCHGEVYQGGMPVWVVEKATADPKQFKLRSEAPGFLAATQRLYSNIYAQVSDLLWKHGGPVIGVQLENECRGPWSYYMALKRMAVSIGFDVPFYTRTGWPKLNGGEKDFGQMLPLYGDYADGFWDRTLDDMPGDYPKAFIMKDTRVSGVIATETFGTNQDTRMDKKDLEYPYLTCELGGGMMTAYHRRINISGREAFPLAVCKVGAGSNLPGYYMYHGGTNPYNPKHTMAECQASPVTNYNDMPLMSYDFQSPLGEFGQLNATAFHQTRWFHQFLADWGDELALMDVDSLSDHYARRGCFEFRNDYVRILHEEGRASVTPKGMLWKGLTITSESVQPFAKADGQLYFITVDGKKPQLSIRSSKGKTRSYKPGLDRPFIVEGQTMTVLSPEKAKSAFVIDGSMHFANYGGIIYKDGDRFVEEVWIEQPESLGSSVSAPVFEIVPVRQAGPLRKVSLGGAKVAEMPCNSDFDQAAVWTVKIEPKDNLDEIDNLFLKVDYKGDVARVYADGKLVEDNFWNGKPMLVRLSELVGKSVEIKILPLSKDYPIYLQKEQKAELERAKDGVLLSLDRLSVIWRRELISD